MQTFHGAHPVGARRLHMTRSSVPRRCVVVGHTTARIRVRFSDRMALVAASTLLDPDAQSKPLHEQLADNAFAAAKKHAALAAHNRRLPGQNSSPGYRQQCLTDARRHAVRAREELNAALVHRARRG